LILTSRHQNGCKIKRRILTGHIITFAINNVKMETFVPGKLGYIVYFVKYIKNKIN